MHGTLVYCTFESLFQYIYSVYVVKDKLKRERCAALGITLIEVPYWWQREQQSLEASIVIARPDLKSITISHTAPDVKTGNGE